MGSQREIFRNKIETEVTVDLESTAFSSARLTNLRGVIMEVILHIIFALLAIFMLPLAINIYFKVVYSFERAVVFRRGRLCPGGPKGPGLVYVLPYIDTVHCIDIRTFSLDVPSQQILTKDGVTISVDAVIQYRVQSPVLAFCSVSDFRLATLQLSLATLQKIIGSQELTQVLPECEVVSELTRKSLAVTTVLWGVKVERAELINVRIPLSLRLAMASEAVAIRAARATIVLAEGELKASRLLYQASQGLINCSSTAVQLKYLQALTTISLELNSTTILPIPLIRKELSY